MNRDRVEGSWKHMVGRVKVRWGQLTQDDYLVIRGRHEQRLGKRQLHLGLAREDADREVARWR